jgi:hypothetical protein
VPPPPRNGLTSWFESVKPGLFALSDEQRAYVRAWMLRYVTAHGAIQPPSQASTSNERRHRVGDEQRRIGG